MSARTPVAMLAALVWLAVPGPACAGKPYGFAPEVYRSAELMVRAGLAEPDGQIVHLGDVLTMVVVVTWNKDALTLEEPNERFFLDGWTGKTVPVVIEGRKERGSGGGGFTDELRYVWRFQLVSCPGEELTCPGDRHYPMPEFTLRYKVGTHPGDLSFRPRPQALTVITAIVSDEAGELRPFAAYFPSGAYPDPLSISNRTPESLTTLGIGSLMLVGGMLMWPLRFRRKQLFAAGERPRWEEVLLELDKEGLDDEKRLADRMRRCLVWYCSDSLKIDPFEWLVRDKAQDESHASLRGLFLDLLHDPSGRSAELKQRLTVALTDRA